MPENMKIAGVLLYAPEGMLLAPLDGSPRLRRVLASPKAIEDMGFAGPNAYAEFMAQVRLHPTKTVHGSFVVAAADSAPLLISASDIRPATENEVRAAIRANLEQSLAELRNKGIVPSIPAEDLMKVLRGEDDEPEAASPRPL
jgi:hypothetical protein